MVTRADLGEPLRLWQVFFSEGHGPGFWRLFTRRGFRHVAAAAYFADQGCWVFVEPCRHRMVISVRRPDEAGPLFAALVHNATVILRVRGREQRRHVPAMFSCVGAIQALLGIRTRALRPHGLYRHLLAQGAEIVEPPQPEASA
jgi:hypothetical protein